MNAVLNEDGLDLGLQLSGPAQHPHGVAAGVLRRALPGIDAHYHSVVLGGGNIKMGHQLVSPGSRRRPADLQSVGLLRADADLGDAAVPGDAQDVLGAPALGLCPIPGGEGHHVIPPVPLQDPHNAACGIHRGYSTHTSWPLTTRRL